MPDAAAIAGSLTEAQRGAIWILSGQWLSRAYAEQMIWLPPSILETGVPLRSGHERVRLTTLGLEVRKYLESRS